MPIVLNQPRRAYMPNPNQPKRQFPTLKTGVSQGSSIVSKQTTRRLAPQRMLDNKEPSKFDAMSRNVGAMTEAYNAALGSQEIPRELRGEIDAGPTPAERAAMAASLGQTSPNIAKIGKAQTFGRVAEITADDLPANATFRDLSDPNNPKEVLISSLPKGHRDMAVEQYLASNPEFVKNWAETNRHHGDFAAGKMLQKDLNKARDFTSEQDERMKVESLYRRDVADRQAEENRNWLDMRQAMFQGREDIADENMLNSRINQLMKRGLPEQDAIRQAKAELGMNK